MSLPAPARVEFSMNDTAPEGITVAVAQVSPDSGATSGAADEACPGLIRPAAATMPSNISDKPSGNRSRLDWRVRYKVAFMNSITPSEVIAQRFVMAHTRIQPNELGFGSILLLIH
jgi:hypothetical protein